MYIVATLTNSQNKVDLEELGYNVKLHSDQKIWDRIHWKWMLSVNTSIAKSFTSAFQ